MNILQAIFELIGNLFPIYPFLALSVIFFFLLGIKK